MSAAKKNALEAADTAIEGEIEPTISEGANTMNTTTERDTVNPDVQKVFDDIAALDPGYFLYFEAGDPLFQTIPPVKVLLASGSDTPDGIVVGEGWYWFATVLDSSGTDVGSMPEECWDAHVEAYGLRSWRAFRSHENAVLRFGDHLVISHGEYLPITSIDADGEVAFELITRSEWRRRERVARENFLIDHPDIVAAKPAWAETVTCTEADGVTLDRKKGASVAYERVFGLVELTRHADWDAETGELRFLDDTTAPSVYLDRVEGTVDSSFLRQVAADLTRAAEFMEATL